jgi:D-alanine-D-alanine ligase
VLGNDPPEALPILEMDFSKVPEGKHRFASSEVKWDEDSELYKATSEFFPEDIPPEVYRRMQEAAVTAFKALRLRDYGRVDMRLRVRRTGPGQAGAEPAETWEFFVIEANPNPDLDRRGEVATAARKAGMTYGQLLDRIISLALARSGLTVGLCPVDVAGDGG